MKRPTRKAEAQPPARQVTPGLLATVTGGPTGTVTLKRGVITRLD